MCLYLYDGQGLPAGAGGRVAGHEAGGASLLTLRRRSGTAAEPLTGDGAAAFTPPTGLGALTMDMLVYGRSSLDPTSLTVS